MSKLSLHTIKSNKNIIFGFSGFMALAIILSGLVYTTQYQYLQTKNRVGEVRPRADSSLSIEPLKDNTVHVGELDKSKVIDTNNTNVWNAVVNVTVHNVSHQPVSNVKVTGQWIGTTGKNSCITNANGLCSIISTKTIADSVIFTINNLGDALYQYNPSLNHDPDGDSNGTQIVISR